MEDVTKINKDVQERVIEEIPAGRSRKLEQGNQGKRGNSISAIKSLTSTSAFKEPTIQREDSSNDITKIYTQK